jgi:hypothetical protein
MLIERMIRAARLDPGLYNEVEQDETATGQAAAVVLIVAVCALIGGAMSADRTHSLIGAALNAIVVWLVWSFVVLVVGRLLGGTADFGEVMRTLAFARTPAILYLFSSIPILGGFASLAAWIWTWLATVVAVREAMDFDTGRAVITVVLPTIILIIVAGLAALVFGLWIFTLVLLGR